VGLALAKTAETQREELLSVWAISEREIAQIKRAPTSCYHDYPTPFILMHLEVQAAAWKPDWWEMIQRSTLGAGRGGNPGERLKGVGWRDFGLRNADFGFDRQETFSLNRRPETRLRQPAG
jgi:hypothetical protein